MYRPRMTSFIFYANRLKEEGWRVEGVSGGDGKRERGDKRAGKARIPEA